jgi:hypothetical protein
MKSIQFLRLAAFFLFAALPTYAQSFSIDWFTIDGGGGTSSGGTYSLSGTIGQPDAGKMSGGTFTLDGGFWAIDAVIQVAGSPTLRIERTATNNLVLAWPIGGSFQLQQNSTFGTGNWSNVITASVNVNGENQVLVPKTLVGDKFYRLQGQ